MLTKTRISSLIVLLLAVNAPGQSSPSATKGYELYSWKIKNHWFYSLLQKTDRPKSFDEITAARTVKRDAAGLTSALQQLPKGEEVAWMSDAPTGSVRPSQSHGISIKHPSRNRIKHIKSICDRLGLRLKLT